MPINLVVKTEGMGATFDFLRDLRGRIGDVSRPLRAFGRVMARSIVENFERQGRPRAWQKLATATLRQRRRQGGPSLILQDKGLLRGGIRHAVDRNTLRIGVAGPAAVYARIQQFGGMAGRGRQVEIPARPYLLFQREDLVEAEALIRQYVEGRAR